MRALAHLSPTDRLLRRDSMRFLDSKRRPSKPKMPPPSAAGEVAVQLESSFALPWSMPVSRLVTAAAAGDRVCALAYSVSNLGLCMVHGDVHQPNDWTAASWRVPEEFGKTQRPPLLALHPRHQGQVMATYPEDSHLLSANALLLHSPPSLTDPIWAAAYDGNGDLWALRLAGNWLRLSHFTSEGQLKSDHQVRSLEEAIGEAGTEAPQPPLPFVVTSKHLVFAVRTRLVAVPIGQETSPEFGEVSLYSPIRSLAQAPLWSSPRVAVVTDSEVYIHWLGSTSHRNLLVCDQLTEPAHAAFTNDGALLVVSGRQGFVIHANSAGKIQRWRFELPSKALALLPLADLWRFAVVDESFRLGRWRYDSRQLGSKASAG
jgi:hypothetical protein